MGCNNTDNDKSGEKSELVTHEEHHHHDEIQKIELNNGEKWKVDDTMLIHIRSMENDVSSFSQSGDNDYKTLAKKLESKIDLLTSNCTMTGKAHDELHKWLLPYIELVTQLGDATNVDEATQKFDNIQASFVTFNNYFN